eukprot:gene17766-24140_t
MNFLGMVPVASTAYNSRGHRWVNGICGANSTEKVIRQSSLTFGQLGYKVTPEQMEDLAVPAGIIKGMVASGDQIVVMHGLGQADASENAVMKIIQA